MKRIATVLLSLLALFAVSCSKGPKVKIVAVIASHCDLCAMQKPALEAIERDFPKQVIIERYDIDIYEQFQASSKFNVKITPTLIFFDKKGNEYFRVDHVIGTPDIRRVLSQKGVK